MSKTNDDSLTAEERARVTSTRRFDLRRILGGLFVLYGLVVTVIGILNAASDSRQTGGIAINLWAGLAMLALGILFFVWDHFAPVPEDDILRSLERNDEEKKEGEGR
ncbi:MAG: hypothetical protein JWR53_1764 [Glaciihabitans sp.]|jgi:hypothetical protein|nr:hypothetical protein [Glaciihabitans sp.]MCU1535283.1 hypothetical protein [Glaciihabitans sp.]MDQ1556027.1 hypothetical protein [Actinomycetota bacterium]